MKKLKSPKKRSKSTFRSVVECTEATGVLLGYKATDLYALTTVAPSVFWEAEDRGRKVTKRLTSTDHGDREDILHPLSFQIAVTKFDWLKKNRRRYKRPCSRFGRAVVQCVAF